MIHYSKFNYASIKSYSHSWKKSQQKMVYYKDMPLSFDIETSTVKLQGVKTPCKFRSFMYLWQFGIDGVAVCGRTWNEFIDFLHKLSSTLKLGGNEWAVVYVHNLGFEFQFLYSQLKIENVFARSAHNPIYFDCPEFCIEFRDSYILSGLSLAKTAKNLTKYKIEKLADFDYSKIRHSKTELVERELQYGGIDVIILNYFIREELEYNGGKMANIPYTRTGYARRRFKSAMHKDKNFWAEWHKRLMHTYPTVEQFALLNKCFSGGYVHGNCNYTTMILSNVDSYDFCSSYPYQMCAHKYPLKKWTKVNCENLDRTTFEKMIDNLPCMCEIAFQNLRAKTPHSIISRSKCSGLLNPIVDNGRLRSAEICRTYITDIDYKIISMFYDFDKIMILEMYTNVYEYLPTPFVNEVLNLFEIKTKLKNVKGKEDEYMRGKGDLNSGYGMLCTNPIDPEITFDPKSGEWSTQKNDDIDVKAQLESNKKSNGYFLQYCVGVWVTAWARYELLSIVYEIDKNNKYGDVIYNDTDSAKITNADKYKKIIDNYNQKCTKTLETALNHHGIDLEKMKPKTIKGDVKQLGIFEHECKYDYFKQLGSKRYCYVKKGEFEYTASGVPKGKPKEYILHLAEKQEREPIEVFENSLTFPADKSDKLTHYCFNDKYAVNITDYQGITEKVNIDSCCVLVPQPYSMNLSNEFIKFLMGLTDCPLTGKQQPALFGKHPILKIKYGD